MTAAKRGCGRSGNRRRRPSRPPPAQTHGREMQVPRLLASGGIGASGNGSNSAHSGSPTVPIQTADDDGSDVPEASQLPWFVAGGQVFGGNPGYQGPYVPSNQVQPPPTLVNTPGYPTEVGYVGDGNGIDDTRVPASQGTVASTYVGHGSDSMSSAETAPQHPWLAQSKGLSTLEYCREAHRNYRPRFHDADADVDVAHRARLQHVVQEASRLVSLFNQGADLYNGSDGWAGYPSEIIEPIENLAGQSW